nr:hypothetical protein [Tanacetum cinerariifolium]
MLHGILRFDGHPSVMMGFLRNIEGIGLHVRGRGPLIILRIFGVSVTKLTTGRMVNGSSRNGIDMVIRNLDLEPKDIIAEFCGPSWWKELSKEMSSKILPCGDGSCWKTFKLIASLIVKGKLK